VDMSSDDGVVVDGNIGRFRRLLLWKLRDKASNITWQYAGL